MSPNELIDAKIQEIWMKNPEIGSRVRLYRETFSNRGEYDMDMFYRALELIEVIFPRNLGFFWHWETGKVILQYRKDADGSLVRVVLQDSSIWVVDSYQELKCVDVISFQDIFSSH